VKIPWISKEKIALKATDLIEKFKTLAKYEVKPPIPVEDIIERYLGLRLLYDDLHKVFGIREAFEKVCAPEPLIIKNSMNDAGGGSGEEPFVEQWPFIAAAMCEAGGFSNVSKHAMIIRLQDLGLLVNKTKKRMDWKALCGDE